MSNIRIKVQGHHPPTGRSNAEMNLRIENSLIVIKPYWNEWAL